MTGTGSAGEDLAQITGGCYGGAAGQAARADND